MRKMERSRVKMSGKRKHGLDFSTEAEKDDFS